MIKLFRFAVSYVIIFIGLLFAFCGLYVCKLGIFLNSSNMQKSFNFVVDSTKFAISDSDAEDAFYDFLKIKGVSK